MTELISIALNQDPQALQVELQSRKFKDEIIHRVILICILQERHDEARQIYVQYPIDLSSSREILHFVLQSYPKYLQKEIWEKEYQQMKIKEKCLTALNEFQPRFQFDLCGIP